MPIPTCRRRCSGHSLRRDMTKSPPGPIALDASWLPEVDPSMPFELRDFIAAQYVAGVAGSQRLRSHKNFAHEAQEIAREAYDVAEALLAERARRDGNPDAQA
jgi:hypothetical protein